jgi:homoserine dehydrogenase
MSAKIKIGLFGFGCVGQGLYDVLEATPSLKAEISKICVKDKNKKRRLPAERFTFNKEEILTDPEINLVVELIDNADDAYFIVKTALTSGKNVVTANKKMLAQHLDELIELQNKYNVSLLYEASSCGSIPIIRNLEEYYDNELLSGVSGIFNGTTNYILTKVASEGLSYADALKQAQDAGFAESDPTNDVQGFDPLFKLIIITAHTYGLYIKPTEVFNLGITTLKNGDINYAREKQQKIKLVPHVLKLKGDLITLFVLPKFVDSTSFLGQVDNEFNAVIVEAAFADKQFFRGKGAGSHPTASAVLSDISANRYNYRYEYKKLNSGKVLKYESNVWLNVYISFNNLSDIKSLDVKNISVQHISNTHNYVEGWVNLNNLIAHRNLILEKQIFVSFLGSPVLTNNEFVELQQVNNNEVASLQA